ncbi:DUF421 domain-containing protein [Dendrosporobacter sp. 1207_IL3150]|uniref:DUF421 domain-containing protein n=1 Tax=Dendrosporobacter sp. 1207_IL3150 TaxID=3084054 RepID=UPI002FDAA04E
MDYILIAQTISVVLLGGLLLRIAGRKSLAQMTVAETVVMISIGSLLVQPLAEESLLVTFGVAATMVITTRLLGYLQIKFNWIEKIFTGKSLVIIENGQLNVPNLAKVALTVDQLEMQLRQSNVKNIEDIQWGTIEPNGRVGFVLKESAQPVTREDLDKLINLINQRLPINNFKNSLQSENNPFQTQNEDTNIFTEISNIPNKKLNQMH